MDGKKEMDERGGNRKGGAGEWKSVIIALIAGITAIVCVVIFSGSIVDYKKTSGAGGLTATGSASIDFESDLVVWRGSFSAYGATPKDAYAIIKKDAEVVRQYLLENGVSEEELVFSSVDISQRYRTEYDENGNYIRDYPDGYDLYQSLSVTSEDIDKVENISRDITKLIESGVEFVSNSPEYYCTKLDEVKLEFTDDALEAIADKAMEKDTGARALRSIIEEFMLDIMYEIPKDDNIGRVTITGDYIRGTGGPLIDIRSNGYSLEERDQMKQIAAAETKEA